MDEEELRQLQDPESWEDEGDPVRPPVRSPRSSVVVGFSSAEFQRIARFARQEGLSTAEFPRRVALDRVPVEGRAPAAKEAGRDLP